MERKQNQGRKSGSLSGPKGLSLKIEEFTKYHIKLITFLKSLHVTFLSYKELNQLLKLQSW